MINSNSKAKDGEQPMSVAWLCLKIAMLLLILAFLLSCITFFSPFWMIELNTLYHTGLWGRCDDLEFNCIWFHERDYAWEKHLPAWHKAAQVMYAIGIGTLTIALVLAIGNLILRVCKVVFNMGIIIGGLILVTTVFETFSIAIFGIGAYQVYDVSINSWVARFEWAFYIGIAAIFNCFFAGIVFIYGGIRMTKEMKGYSSYA